MKKTIFILATIFFFISCQNMTIDEVKKKSFEDIYFYLSEMKLINLKDELHFIDLKIIYEKNNDVSYEIKYQIKKRSDSLWLIQYYNESRNSVSLNIKESTKLKNYTDSIFEIYNQNKEYHFSKRWKWVIVN